MAHEEQDPRNLLILGIGLGSIVVLAATMLGVQGYYNTLKDEQHKSKIGQVEDATKQTQRSDEDRKLGSYAMLDKARGRVRIPIDAAMTTLAKKGRDAIPAIQPKPAALPGHELAAAAGAGGAPAAEPPAEKKDDKKEEKKDDKKDDKKKDDKKKDDKKGH